MQKNKKIVLILVLAFVVAAAGAVALYFFLTPQKTTIYTFKENISAGTVITKDMLTPVQADSNIYMGGAKVNASEYYVTGENVDEILKSGDSLRADVVKGMPFTYSLLTSGGGSRIEMQMDTTKIAITVPVNNITGVTNELKTGSRVNVYASSGGNTDVITKMIFQNMRVLATQYDKNGSLLSVTLECDTDQSMELVYYSTYASIYLGLVDGSSYQYTSVNNPYLTESTGSVTQKNKGDEMLETIDDEETNTAEDGDASETTSEEETTEEETTSETTENVNEEGAPTNGDE